MCAGFPSKNSMESGVHFQTLAHSTPNVSDSVILLSFQLAVPKSGKGGYEIIHSPPCSHDLNVAQDVLLFLKKRIQKARFGNINDLKCGILKEWDCISVHRVNKLVNSMPTRLADVAKQDGRAI